MSNAESSLFVKRGMIGTIIDLVDDIVITSNDLPEISKHKIFFILNFLLRIWEF